MLPLESRYRPIAATQPSLRGLLFLPHSGPLTRREWRLRNQPRNTIGRLPDDANCLRLPSAGISTAIAALLVNISDGSNDLRDKLLRRHTCTLIRL